MDENAQKQRASSIALPTPKTTLGASKGTSYKRNKITEDLPQGLVGSSGDSPRRNYRAKA